MRSKLIFRYIFFEILPSYLLGAIVFISILLTFQALRLTEFVLLHGFSIVTVLRIMMYLSISFLPVILPMTLLFSILLTYGRLSSDSEIVAMKALGLRNIHLAFPALLIGFITVLIAAQTAFTLAPWGNRKFEILINKLAQVKASAAIKEGVFSEGFFNLVVYANKVDSKNGLLDKVFIYDERNPEAPLTIIAQSGIIDQKSDFDEQSATLLLKNGNIHKTANGTYTKIQFENYNISLNNPINLTQKDKSNLSLNYNDLRALMTDPNVTPERRLEVATEFHKRWALSLAAMVFAILGVGLGLFTNKRSGKSNGFVVSMMVIVAYWGFYVFTESLAKNGTLPPGISVWLANIVFFAFGIYKYRQLPA